MKNYRKVFKLSFRSQASFTLVETVVALSIMAFVIIEVAGIQGRGIYFSSYTLRQSQAMWLAKRLMSQVEYFFYNYSFDELDVERNEVPFADAPDFKYSLSIKEWQLPLVELLTSSLNTENSDTDQPLSAIMKQALEQVLDKSLLKVAYVQVFWPEGAFKNSVSLTYLLTNQKKVDEILKGFKPLYDKIGKGQSKKVSN